MLRSIAAFAVFRPRNDAVVYAVGLLFAALALWGTLVFDQDLIATNTPKNAPIVVSRGISPVAPPSSSSPSGTPTAALTEEAQGVTPPRNPWAEAHERQRIRGEIVVSDPPQNFASLAEGLGFRILESVDLDALGMRIVRARIPSGQPFDRAVNALRRRVPGLRIDADHLFDPSGGKAPPTPHYASVRAVAGWQNVAADCGKGLRIGMVDSGVETTHPALKNSHVITRAFPSAPHAPARGGHGTAVAAEIAGSAQWGGLLPGATLYAADMFEVDDNGKTIGSVMGLAKSLNWLAGEHLQVVNLSIAGADNRIVREVVSRAAAQGMILVAAAGNWGPKAKPAFPAAYREVIAVTATLGDGNGAYPYANQGNYIEFSEPGVGLWTAVDGGGKTQSGTSFAAPIVSVLAALKAHRDGPRANIDTVRGFLRQYAHDLGAPGDDPVFGWGVSNILPYCSS